MASSREQRLVVRLGARAGDRIASRDGTVLRIATGYTRASRKACAKNPSLGAIPSDVVADDDHPHAGIGQACACRNPWPNCHHEGSATFCFLKIGMKIMKVCEDRGTNSAALLQGEWTWKEALTAIKGPSGHKPPWMQLRRTLFALMETSPKLQFLVFSRGFRAFFTASSQDVEGTLRAIRPFLLGCDSTAARSLCLDVAGDLPSPTSTRPIPGLNSNEVQLAWYAAAGQSSASVENLRGNSPLERVVWDEVRALTPSQLKSLLQKLVRWGDAVQVRLTEDDPNGAEIGDVVLRAAFIALFFGPGAFLPALRDHSTGQRLALHRMVITLFEDGVDPVDVSNLTYWGALAATQQKNETPVPFSVVEEALRALVRGRHSLQVLSWREQKNRWHNSLGGKSVKKDPRPTNTCFPDLLNIFENIGAMETDKAMIAAVREISFSQAALRERNAALPWSVSLKRVLFMHLDQHAEPLMPHVVKSFDWFSTTGFNPRTATAALLDREAAEKLGPAQQRALEHSQKTKVAPCCEIPGALIHIPYSCPPSALIAYSAGHVHVQLERRSYWAVFCPTDLNQIVLMRKPNQRESTELDYIEPFSHEYESVIEALRRKDIALGDPLEPKRYKLRWNKTDRVWETNIPLPTHMSLPAHPAEKPGLGWTLAASPSGDGCREDWKATLRNSFEGLGQADRTEVVRMLSEVTPACEVKMMSLPRSARPHGLRHAVYTFVGVMAHQCPGALVATSAGTWQIRNKALFSHLRDFVCEWYAGIALVRQGWSLTCTVDPHSQQQECLDRAQARQERRTFLMAKTGAGKTLVAVHLLASAVNAGEVDHVFFFMDTDAGLNSVVAEVNRSCDCDCVWLDPRLGGNRKWLAKDVGLAKGEVKWRVESMRGSPLRPSGQCINVLKYDHFAQYPDLRDNIIAVSATSLAVYDEVDRCYGETTRSKQCVPLAFLFKRLVMMTATPLRRHGEGLGPRLAIASLFAPFPLQEQNILVFFCGHVKSFEHPMPYPQHYLPNLFVDITYPSKEKEDASFDELAKAAFSAALPQLLTAALALGRMAEGPCIVAVQSLAQVQELLRAAGDLAEEAPAHPHPPTAPLVVLAANAARGRNFGRHCNAMIHLPLKQGVPARQQLHGRLHRGPLRKLYYQLVIPRGSVLECLAALYERDDATALELEHFVRQAAALKRDASQMDSPSG